MLWKTCVSVIHIESDWYKRAKLMRRGGRNIRALEAASRVEICGRPITPWSIINFWDWSSSERNARPFSSQMVQDGRIHACRMRKSVAKKNLRRIRRRKSSKSRANLYRILVFMVFHPELIRMVGRIRYSFFLSAEPIAHSERSR